MIEKTYISVILPLRLEWTPFYSVPTVAVKSGSVRPGTRLKVLFAGRAYIAVVAEVGVKPDMDTGRIASVVSLEELPPVSPLEIRLWYFIASYYMCSVGEVYKAAYPSGKTVMEQVMARMRGKRQQQLRAEEERLSSRLAGLQGRLVKKEEILKFSKKDSVRKREATEMADKLRTQIAETQAHIAELRSLAGKNPAPDGAKGSVSGAYSDDSDASGIIREVTLSSAQGRASREIAAAFAAGKPALLNGVTGSGKTEIYISFALKALRQGRNVLYLVPEIALSRQLEDRLRVAFGDLLLTAHSGETIARRGDVSERVRRGSYIVLGTRSSLLLPHHDLGLVVVDEEHDSSYKQTEPAPRYNGRDMAIVLAKLHGSDVILGSATPSFESLYNCGNGKYCHVLLSRRYYDTEDARVEIIDTIAERRKGGMAGSFSRKLIAHIDRTLKAGSQVIVLRGRRAYSPAVQCEACGEIPRCPCCNAALSYHRDIGRLVCHYCGHREPYTASCPNCKGRLSPMGAGTQKAEEEIVNLFPTARVARMDGDTVKDAKELVSEFSAGKIDILIGTQMVAKGFDFKGLDLVAIIQSDSLLGQQDFRADEKALQLMEQFRGRVGRRGGGGLLVVQTSQPGHPVYSCLVNGRQPDFLKKMLEERKSFAYPPYSKIVNILLKDCNLLRLEGTAAAMAREIATAFKADAGTLSYFSAGGIRVIGPYSPAVDKVSNEYIRHIRVIFLRDRHLESNKKRLAAVVSEVEKNYGRSVHIHIDVDPA